MDRSRRGPSTLKPKYEVSSIVSSAKTGSSGNVTDFTPFETIIATVDSINDFSHDYAGLLFLVSKNAGPTPRPNKSPVSYSRVHNTTASGSAKLSLHLTLGSLARSDTKGDLTIFSGDYTLELDNDKSLTFNFTLTGDPFVIDSLPAPKTSYEFLVPVHIQRSYDRALGPAYRKCCQRVACQLLKGFWIGTGGSISSGCKDERSTPVYGMVKVWEWVYTFHGCSIT
ncbi:beta-xylosidase [Colletotrichum tofieldiae]|nr:beta-xylosidase [Colletotrichum tofieldiae]